MAIEKCPIGGLAQVDSYNTNNRPIFKGQLLKGGTKKKKILKGGNRSICSNFNANLCKRDFNCSQPIWKPSCI